MISLKPVRGTHDLLGKNVQMFSHIEKKLQSIARSYAYDEIRTPIFEQLAVFDKNIGQSTDIIGKEMYVFEDRGGEKLALRPEGTAPVVRAIISNGLLHLLPLKFYYSGSMFRYERPQKGRTRQFHQLGFEYIGTNSYIADIEMIAIAVKLLVSLDITDFTVQINTLGSIETLKSYKDILIEYLLGKKHELSEDSLHRLQKNPLRILDSKDEKDQGIIQNCPKILDYLPSQDKEFFDNVCQGLSALNISYEVNPNLVRGLDYYNHTVFEIVTNSLGSAGTLIAGGRYNHLLGAMGGGDLGAFGFAGGMERMALMMKEDQLSKTPLLAILYVNETAQNIATVLLHEIVSCNLLLSCNMILGRDIKSQLKKVAQGQYKYILIIESDGSFTFKTQNINNLDVIKISSQAELIAHIKDLK